MTIQEFQALIERIYYAKDAGRGWAETYVWFVEEVGELGRAMRSETREEIEGEFADVLAWLTTLASLYDIDLQAAAAAKYGAGCPKCRQTPCACAERRRPDA